MERPSTTPAPVGRGAVLRLEGRDTVGVVHRIWTAFLEDLPPGECRVTLFCDFRGRLLHRVVVGLAPGGAVWLARADAPFFFKDTAATEIYTLSLHDALPI